MKKIVSLVIFLVPALAAAGIMSSVGFEWQPNTEPELVGYRLFIKEAGQEYNYAAPAWDGPETTCTISNFFDDTKTYYMVLRAYGIVDSQEVESEDSNEVALINGIAYGLLDPSGLKLHTEP